MMMAWIFTLRPHLLLLLLRQLVAKLHLHLLLHLHRLLRLLRLPLMVVLLSLLILAQLLQVRNA
jgi:hypothetical protein